MFLLLGHETNVIYSKLVNNPFKNYWPDFHHFYMLYAYFTHISQNIVIRPIVDLIMQAISIVFRVLGVLIVKL